MALPRHHRLNNLVQCPQVGGQADLDAAPDAELAMQEFDAQAGNPVGHGGLLSGTVTGRIDAGHQVSNPPTRWPPP